MDERIENLLNDRGHGDLLMRVDDEDLAERMLTTLRRLDTEEEALGEAIGRALPGQLALMGQMGIDFVDELRRVYPDFPIPERPRRWEAHLPAFGPELRTLMERFA